jgi:hypothetical protein
MAIKIRTHYITSSLVAKVLVGFCFLASCSPDLNDDNIALAHFPDIILNLTLPSNNMLVTKGGYKEIGGGVRGIIVYCQDPGVYLAYERNCSYQPGDACATVNVDGSKLFMIDQCCGSSFNFSTGTPMGGVAWRSLRKYKTSTSGNELTITEEIID